MLYFDLLNFLKLYLLCLLCKANKYCDFSEIHVMCKYNGLGLACKGATGGGVSGNDQVYILDFHNNVRKYIARGLETRGFNENLSHPQASDMMKLSWDGELQAIAQRWADQCTYEKVESRVERWEVGQSLYLSKKEGISHWSKPLHVWFKEIKNFNGNNIHNYKFHSTTSHFTQMAWANTYRIGCGMRSWSSNTVYVCNYGPAGNVPNTTMYKEGDYCSNCPKPSECEFGLCAYPESFLKADVIDTESPGMRKSMP